MTDTEVKNKTKVIALLEAGYRDSEIVERMEIPAGTVKRWKKEWNDVKDTQHISDLAQKNEIAVLAETSILSDTIKVLSMPEQDKEVLLLQVEELTEGLKGLSILNSTLQVAAIKITQNIIDCLTSKTEANEILQLSGALAKLNDTFFNPNNTSVNILNQDGGQTNLNGGGPFAKYMKD